MIRVPMLVPGLEYTFETLVECISDLGISDQLYVFVTRDEVNTKYSTLCTVSWNPKSTKKTTPKNWGYEKFLWAPTLISLINGFFFHFLILEASGLKKPLKTHFSGENLF